MAAEGTDHLESKHESHFHDYKPGSSGVTQVPGAGLPRVRYSASRSGEKHRS